MNKAVILGGLAVVAAAGFFWYSNGEDEGQAAATEVVMPELSSLATQGALVFDGTCAACHGVNLVGTDDGPPLLHAFYKPGHHGDFAIVNAVKNGSHQHHWRFGDMPAQPHISDDEIVQVIAYIRAVQVANGFE